MTQPTLSEICNLSKIRTITGFEGIVLNAGEGKILQSGEGSDTESVATLPPETIVTHFCNDLNIWKPFN